MDPHGAAQLRNLSVADYIAQCLADCGVTHVFGGHGGAIVPLINSIVAHPNLTFIYTRCEVNASMAAAAYAKLRQGLGCCIGTSGPGSSHLTTGLLEAALDRVPVLCLTGTKKSAAVGYSDFQDIRQAELFRAAGLDFSLTVMQKNQVIPLMRDAVAVALTTFSAVHLAVPVDVQQEVICPPPVLCARHASLRTQPMVAHPQYLAHAAALIQGCRDAGRAILLAVGQRAVGAGEAILALAELLDAPVVTTQDAKGLVRETHPLVLGVAGIFGNPGMVSSAKLIQDTDLVVSFGWDNHTQLLVGADGLQERMLVEFEPAAALVESRFQAIETIVGNILLCCQLLYQMLSVGPAALDDLPAEGGANAVCQMMLQHWAKQPGTLTPNSSFSFKAAATGAELMGRRSSGARVVDRTLTPSGYIPPVEELRPGCGHPGQVLALLSTRLEDDAVVCVDVGDVTIWTSLSCCLGKPGQRMLASMRLGTMGYSLCAGLAAVACRPDKQVVVIAGDGGIQMSLNELATLRQMKARRVLVVVLTNGMLGRVANETWGPAGEQPPSGCEIESPDFVKLAEAYGGKGARLATIQAAEIDEALDAAFAHEGLFVLEVVQDRLVKPCMAKYQAPTPTQREQRRRHLDSRSVNLSAFAVIRTQIGPSPVEVHQGILYRPNAAVNYAVTFHGHVDFVIKGTVPQQILDTPIPAASIRYAFEAGTVLPDDIDSIGEMMAVKGKVYVKCTDKARPDYYSMLTGNSMIAPAAGIITPADAVPLLTVELRPDAAGDRTFAQVLAAMLQTLRYRPFCAGGRVAFRHLYATAICKSTIHQENIFEHKEEYYDPKLAAVHLEGRAGYVFGFVADFKKANPDAPCRDIRRVLYPGSGGKAGAVGDMNVSVHFHVCVLRAEFSEVSYDDLEPSMFEDIQHLDCSSVVRALDLEVYPIQDMHPHVLAVSDALPPFSHLEPDGTWVSRSVVANAEA